MHPASGIVSWDRGSPIIPCPSPVTITNDSSLILASFNEGNPTMSSSHGLDLSYNDMNSCVLQDIDADKADQQELDDVLQRFKAAPGRLSQ